MLALYDYIFFLLSVTFVVRSLQSHSSHCSILDLIQIEVRLYTANSDTKISFAS